MQFKTIDGECDYILLEDGLRVIDYNPVRHEIKGEGIVLQIDDEYSLIIWNNGEVNRYLYNDTHWVIFKEVGKLTPLELFAARIKYSDYLKR